MLDIVEKEKVRGVRAEGAGAGGGGGAVSGASGLSRKRFGMGADEGGEGCGFDAVDSVKDYEELGERSASYFERASEDSEAERKVQGTVQQNPGVRGALDEILRGLGGAGSLREEDRKR